MATGSNLINTSATVNKLTNGTKVFSVLKRSNTCVIRSRVDILSISTW